MRRFFGIHHVGLEHAIDGIVWAFRTQPNFRVHSFCALLAVGLSILFGVSFLEWIIVIFTIVLGFTAEMINTSIEAMTDLITTEYRKEAKVAKDVAAGMMLLVGIGSILVASIIFLPRFFTLLTG